jgi:hypothetical protein
VVAEAALSGAAERVRKLARTYEPPDFSHVPDPDTALFLCAQDHKTGYTRAHLVDGEGPFAGSELLWMVALRAADSTPGLLTSNRLRYASAADVADLFRIGGETVRDPERRAFLWRDLAAGLERDYQGSATQLLAAAGGRLGDEEGLVALLSRYVAYSDPLAKKAFLFAKIAERRGWISVHDPENWEVAADNVLMRLALRSGLVADGPLASVRRETRAALKALAGRAGMSPPVLDDLLWELGRDDPDLLGTEAGALTEPPRDPQSAWY